MVPVYQESTGGCTDGVDGQRFLGSPTVGQAAWLPAVLPDQGSLSRPASSGLGPVYHR